MSGSMDELFSHASVEAALKLNVGSNLRYHIDQGEGDCFWAEGMRIKAAFLVSIFC